MPTDRNLLFGILALQTDFISREQLLAATSEWLRDKARSLESILFEQEALGEEDRQLLVPLVERHIHNHDGDAEKSLASLSSIGSIADELKQLGDPEIDATISFVGQDKRQGDGPKRRKVDNGSRFRILRPHAKGGLGEVSVAEDVELSREVALKEIQTRFADDPQSRSRFVLEAEVTGGLEHPGIVPVYGLGQYDDGRPFYAMRFIRGDSLKDAADRFHNTKDPVEYTGIAFRKLLGRFIDVCNAIEYAHSRGVLHRDLKPGNIMLGKYGETLVVDWGLAKLQGRDDEAKVEGETTLHPSSGSGVEPTQMGSAVGTPAYMPPEQAAGNPDQLGPASDVYSLGATLYHLLTGQSPVKGKDLGEVLKRVQDGDFLPPRQVKPDVPKALEAICLHAMSTRPQDRYASPRELADDMERYLADDAVTAFPDPLVDRARRWVRKHQTLAITTAAVVLVSAIGLGAFSTIVSAKNRELTQANKRESDARREAEANELAAKRQGQLALSTLTSVIFDVQDGLSKLSGGGEIRSRLLNTSLAKLDAVATQYVEKAQVDHATVGALIEMGDLIMKFGVETTEASQEGSANVGITEDQKSAVKLAGRFFRRAHQIAEKLAADDPSDAMAQLALSISYNKIGVVQLQSGQLDEALKSNQESLEIAKKLTADDPSNAQVQRNLSLSYDKIGEVQFALGQSDEALKSYQRSLEIRESLAAYDPSNAEAQRDLSVSYGNIGNVQSELGQSDEALKSYQMSVEISENLAAYDPSDAMAQLALSYSYSGLGDQQHRSGQLDEARESHQKCLEIAKKLAADDPSNSQAQVNLSISYSMIGNVQLGSGQSDEALKSYQMSLEITEKLASDDPSNTKTRRSLSLSYGRIGDAQHKAGKTDEALKSHQKSLEIAKKLAADDPSNTEAQSDLSISYNKIGDVQLGSGQSDEALKSYQKSLEITEKLAADDPNNARAQQNLSAAHSRVGDIQLQSGQLSEAGESHHKSLEIARKLAADDPNNAQVQRNLSVSYDKIGNVQLQSEQSDDALKSYQKGLEIREKLATDNPNNTQAQRGLYISYDRIGNVQLQLKQLDESRESLHKSLEIAKKLAADDPSNAQAQRDLMISHYRLGEAHRALADYETAAAEYELGATVLRRMILQGMNAEASRKELAFLEAAVASANRAITALGEWAALLKQPAEALPSLLDERGIEFTKRSQFGEAAQAAAKLRTLGGADKGQLYNSACVFSLCAASIKPNAGDELSDEQTKQRERYITDALSTLKQAVDAGWDNFDHMKKDSDLAILRDRAEFEALIPKAESGVSEKKE